MRADGSSEPAEPAGQEAPRRRSEEAEPERRRGVSGASPLRAVRALGRGASASSG